MSQCQGLRMHCKWGSCRDRMVLALLIATIFACGGQSECLDIYIYITKKENVCDGC